MTTIRTTYHNYIGIICLTLTLLLSACSDDGTPDNQRILHLVPATRTITDVPTQVTRALPSGYEALNVNTAFPNNKDMLAFITPDKASPTSADIFIRRFTYYSDWQTNIAVSNPDDSYYIYGFIPLSDDTSDEVAIQPINNNYKNGAKLTVMRLKTLTASDVCIISGIKKVNSQSTTIADASIVPGSFVYNFTPAAEADYACMLLDHLYAKLSLQICIDDTYNNLRTIKVKSLKLQVLNPDNTDQGIKTVNAEVNIVANNTGADPVSSITFKDEVFGGEPLTVFTDNTTGQELTTEYVSIGIPVYTLFKAPNGVTKKNQWLRITSDYDVYDKKNNLIREVRDLTNTFTLGIVSENQKAGLAHTIKLKVQPTYLYVLSEPDLDSPTIKTE